MKTKTARSAKPASESTETHELVNNAGKKFRVTDNVMEDLFIASRGHGASSIIKDVNGLVHLVEITKNWDAINGFRY